MKTHSIAVLPGDGTGPEVVREGIKVAEVAAKKFGFKLDWHPYDFGGERFLKTGEVLPDSAIAFWTPAANVVVVPARITVRTGPAKATR